jgi:hypothetical protein
MTTRRQFLRGAGVALALPWLEALAPRRSLLAAPEGPPRRTVLIMTNLGMHGPNFFPEKAGKDYALPPLLEPLSGLRTEFTVCSGLWHIDVDGGHSSENSFLTAIPHPHLPTFKNSISFDQFLLEKLGPPTRVPYLNLTTIPSSPLSWSRRGVNLPAEDRPSKVFARLFLDGSANEIADLQRRLQAGKSVLDAVQEQAKSLEKSLSGRDKEKLDEYFAAVREVEQRLAQAEAWSKKPKPKVNARPPGDNTNPADAFPRARLMYDVTHLALETDSTRIVCLAIRGGKYVPTVKGVTMDWHNLSHHGMDSEKLDQLRLVEMEQMKELARFLARLKESTDAGGTLLDRTAVLFGSNLGNASSHDTHNMPVLLAGGGFKHGTHLAFDRKNNTALCRLFVSIMQRLGVEGDTFVSGKGTLPGLDMA